MNYETVVPELFKRFPRFQTEWEARVSSMGNKTSIQYMVFGSLLLPALEEALSTGNLGVILPICAFLEDAAEGSKVDRDLESLLLVEVGEWLEEAANEPRLTPWLGTETKRVCRYVPGLATQRHAVREGQKARSLGRRFAAFIKRLLAK